MPTPPMLKPTTARSETFAGVSYHLDGELVPVLTVDITPDQSVYFEHHILLWKHPTVQIAVKSIKGALKRLMAGMRSEEHTSELQSRLHLVCRLLLEKKK